MTAVLERWWAPEAQVPLASLLTPGGDGKKDLAQGLFALHRAGAEACELVAKTAVADEAVLIAALAENRLHVVPKALDVISKGVSTPQYAGLLVRDILDDAESAALALYRTCLAKSVPPPVAAQRVGLVYGVPGRELGRYATLAADPSAKEVAVRDAADRALFTYISKVVEAEHDEAKVEISKEGERVRERPQQSAYLDEHNVVNDPATGRFAPEGTSRLARIAGRARGREDTAARREARDKRERREKREARAAQSPARSSTARTASSQARSAGVLSRKSAARRATTAVRAERSRVQLSANARLMQSLAVIADEPKAPKPMGLGDVPDMLTERPDPNRGLHGDLKVSLGFAMPSKQWSAAVQGMGEGAEVTKPVFLAGALEEYAGTPELFQQEVDDDGNVVLHEDHEHQVAQAAAVAKADPELQGRPEKWIRRLESGITRGMDPYAVKAMLEEEAKDLLKEYEDYEGIRAPYMTERGYVSLVPAYDDPETWVIVYNPPGEGPRGGKRPTANVTEVEIPDNVARGIDQGNRHHTDFTLEQNQGLQIEETKRFFDTDLGVFRTRVTLGRADDRVIEAARDRREQRWQGGKAMSSERFRELERAGVYQRDEDGEFSTTSAQPEAKVERVIPGRARGTSDRRTARARRARREAREARQAQAETRPLSQARSTTAAARATEARPLLSSVRTSAARMEQRATMRTALARRPGQEELPEDVDAPPLLQLDPKRPYSIIDAETMSIIAADDGFASPEYATQPWALGWRAREQLPVAGKAAAAEVQLLTDQIGDDDLQGRQIDQENGVRGIASVPIRGKQDLWRLESAITREMADSGGQRVLTAHLYEVDGEMVAELVVHDRIKPPQYLLRWEAKRNTDADLQLVPEGEYHMLDPGLVRSWLEAAYDSAMRHGHATRLLHNPRVIVYRVQEQP